MSFLSSIPIWGWFDIFSNVVVLVALCGESHWALKWLIPNNSKGETSVKWRREKLKKKFEFLLIIGIAGEVGCLPLSLIESAHLNKEAADAQVQVKQLGVQIIDTSNVVAQANERIATAVADAAKATERAAIAGKDAAEANERAAKLDEARVMVEKDVAELRKEASDSKLFAAQIGTTNAQLVATNLLVKKQVEELHKENLLLAARTIMQSQLEIFTNMLKGDLKFPVRIFVPDANEGFETENFSLQIRELLDAAGYGRGKNEGIEKVRLNRNFPIGTSDNLQLYFIFYGKQNEGINWPSLKIKTEGHKVTISTTVSPKNDLSAVPGIIHLAFQEIGISSGIWVGEYRDFLKPGEWGIFIPQKL